MNMMLAAAPSTLPSSSGWTPARRARQREAIRRWSPWKKSTGPRTPAGKTRSAQNAFKHGYRGAQWREIHALLSKQRRYVRYIMILFKIGGLAAVTKENTTNELLERFAENPCFHPFILGRSRDIKGKMT